MNKPGLLLQKERCGGWMLLLAGLWAFGMITPLHGSAKEGGMKTGIERERFGKTKEGEEVFLYQLCNRNGAVARITDYGGIVTTLLVPDRNGKLRDVVLGFNTLDEYLAGHPYFGALIGRYGNRIAGGRFELNGTTFKLATNDGKNHLHGGITGFDKVLWKGKEIRKNNASGVELTYLSRDGEEGYPGNLSVAVVYELTDQNELRITYQATTDAATPVNLTYHGYFNLDGEGTPDMLDERMTIMADRYTPVSPDLIPTGEIKAVRGTALDFTAPHPIGERIQEVTGGYDHNYVLNRKGEGLELAASAVAPGSGIVMEVLTTEPGIQFYSGNFLDGALKGKGGRAYQRHSGFCLEAQHYPDSPNHPDFPSTVLHPGQIYRQTTVYRFSIRR